MTYAAMCLPDGERLQKKKTRGRGGVYMLQVKSDFTTFLDRQNLYLCRMKPKNNNPVQIQLLY